MLLVHGPHFEKQGSLSGFLNHYFGLDNSLSWGFSICCRQFCSIHWLPVAPVSPPSVMINTNISRHLPKVPSLGTELPLAENQCTIVIFSGYMFVAYINTSSDEPASVSTVVINQINKQLSFFSWEIVMLLFMDIVDF